MSALVYTLSTVTEAIKPVCALVYWERRQIHFSQWASSKSYKQVRHPVLPPNQSASLFKEPVAGVRHIVESEILICNQHRTGNLPVRATICSPQAPHHIHRSAVRRWRIRLLEQLKLLFWDSFETLHRVPLEGPVLGLIIERPAIPVMRARTTDLPFL